ncbi:MAG: hypothetical protein ACO2OY_10630 [Thermodesulfobacteriaceae bacterium]|jgi:hypothetical protein
MNKEKLNKERFLTIHFNNNESIMIDVNNDVAWKKILDHKDKIIKIETEEWSWNLMNGEISLL